MDGNNDNERSPLIADSSNAINRESPRNRNTFEWWERPKEARGTTHHLRLSVDLVLLRQYTESNRSLGAFSEKELKDLAQENEIGSLAPNPRHEAKKLGQFLATAIAGNDITSSVLYVSGYAAYTCGVYAPISLFMVAVLLALFRPIYTEVVTALPMNGGTYNALLNTTSKQVASVAGALSLLSYTATAVVSATSAMQYLQALWADLNIYYAVIILLAFFAFLNLIGLTESAVVATLLFIVHCTTLMVLIVMSAIKFFSSDFSLLQTNWHTHTVYQENPALSIYFGYGAAMLGITGFETSANYVEEQAPGVFPKTLRNMWFAVAFFNPVISVLSFGILPLSDLIDPAKSGALLNLMAKAAGGEWLEFWVSIDAVLVLSGAVLTAYVGVTGLSRRLALDRILAQFLLAENSLRHTNHWIIIGFFLLCSSLFLIVRGQIEALSGVYTSAFLCVMAMFAFANMMLKYKRSRLPRDVETPWLVTILGFIGVILAFIGNALANPSMLMYFAFYFSGTMFLFLLMFYRVRILKILLYFVKLLVHKQSVHNAIAKKIQELNSSKIIFFTRDDNLAVLNKVMLYVRDNEQTNWVILVHVYKDLESIPPKLEEHCRLMEQLWPKYRVDYVQVKGEFGPAIIDNLAAKFNVPKNFMFITTPSENFTHKVADLGGVRLVTH